SCKLLAVICQLTDTRISNYWPQSWNFPLAASCQMPAVLDCRLSSVSCKLLAVSCELTIIHERGKRIHFQARPAYQRAVDLFLGHQPANIVGLDAAAVKNAHGVGFIFAELL